MANHLLPAVSSTYVNYTSEINARIDDALKLLDSSLTYSNPPVGAYRWNGTSTFTWEKNTGTSAAPTWTTASTRYDININGTVGATTANTGNFTNITASGTVSGAGINSLFASPPNLGVTAACGIATINALTVNSSAALPSTATVGGILIVSTSGSQVLTAKTLTQPTIGTICSTGAIVLTLPTGASDTLVARTTTDTLTNKTLTSPRIIGGDWIADGSGNELVGFSSIAAATNNLEISNATNGGTPTIAAVGSSDTTISINIAPKGAAGKVLHAGIESVDISAAQTLSNKTISSPQFIGTVSGTGLDNYMASPPTIGGTVANAGVFKLVNITAGNLATTAGTSVLAAILKSDTGNANQLEIGHTRVAVGTDWTTSSMRLQRKVDTTWGGLVEFYNDTVRIGTGTNTTSGNSVPIRVTISNTGDLTCTGNVTAYSDLRLKYNIELIPNALEKVCALRGVTFNRKDSNCRYTGLIAQEVQEVLPEVVIENKDDEKFLSVAYGNMVGLLVEAIKELKQEIDELKGK